MTDLSPTAQADEPAVPAPPADGDALPEGYIDPEHSGDDRALLETYYAACQAEGGTADDITLRGLRAVLDRWGSPAPEGREPAAAAGRPTDEELDAMERQCYCETEVLYGNGCEYVLEHRRFARAVLARWGNPAPAPPVDGEVADVVRWLGSRAGIPASPDFPAVATYLTRAAELLQRQVLVPVPVAERPWERDGWCDELGRCWFGWTDEPDASWSFCKPSERDTAVASLPAQALPRPEAAG